MTDRTVQNLLSRGAFFRRPAPAMAPEARSAAEDWCDLVLRDLESGDLTCGGRFLPETLPVAG